MMLSDRAAILIAEADFFGDRPTCEKYGVSIRTLQRWRQRTHQDSELAHSVAQKKQLLLEAWQIESSLPLKIAFEELARRMPTASTAEDAKILHAIAGVCKVLGEMKLASSLLLDG